MIIKATTRPITGVIVEGREIDFGGKTRAAMVKDAGLAREIKDQFGDKGELIPGQVAVVPIRNANREAGHTYTFTVPQMPWKK